MRGNEYKGRVTKVRSTPTFTEVTHMRTGWTHYSVTNTAPDTLISFIVETDDGAQVMSSARVSKFPLAALLEEGQEIQFWGVPECYSFQYV